MRNSYFQSHDGYWESLFWLQCNFIVCTFVFLLEGVCFRYDLSFCFKLTVQYACVIRMYLWWSLCTPYFACMSYSSCHRQFMVGTADSSGLCCCVTCYTCEVCWVLLIPFVSYQDGRFGFDEAMQDAAQNNNATTFSVSCPHASVRVRYRILQSSSVSFSKFISAHSFSCAKMWVGPLQRSAGKFIFKQWWVIT